MKSKISIFALSFATVCMMSSCLGDKNDTEIVFYDDAAITVLTLGELKKPSHSGKENDSIKIVGSKYTLKIDQYGGTITNAPDSLPVETNLKNVKFSTIPEKYPNKPTSFVSLASLCIVKFLIVCPSPSNIPLIW